MRGQNRRLLDAREMSRAGDHSKHGARNRFCERGVQGRRRGLVLISTQHERRTLDATRCGLEVGVAKSGADTRVAVDCASLQHVLVARGIVRQQRGEMAASVNRQIPLNLPQGPAHPYLRLPMLAATPQGRERIHSSAQRRGLGVSLAYPTPINEIPELTASFNGKRFPSARNVADCLLTIPTHHWLSERDKQAIADAYRAIPAA